MQSCIDGIGVSWPMRRATIWSSDVPTYRSEPCVCFGMRLREEHGARAEVIAADLRRFERFGHAHVGVAHDRQILAPRLERRERAVLAEARSCGQCPPAPTDACDAPQALLPAAPCTASMATRRVLSVAAASRRTSRRRGRPAPSRRGRAGRRRAQSPEERAAMQVLLRQERHSWDSSVRVNRALWRWATSAACHRRQWARRACCGTHCCSRRP